MPSTPRRSYDHAHEPADETLIAGRYRVLAELGKGGSAQVYRVRDSSTGTELALKQLIPDASAKLTALFELEYQTLASLHHPRVVQVFDYGRDASGAFYTMELLHGEDLKECAPLPWREACTYLRDAAQALGLLHARKLIHRDVSPRNLWRTPDGRVKLIDFGALAPFGPLDHVMGTPPLVPPEAFYGAGVDQRADLYALGAVAYYLLTGMHAFPARDLRELPELWTEPPATPSQCVEELSRSDLERIPPEFDALIMAMLSQDVLARPNSTLEVIDRLETLLGMRRSLSDAADVQLSNSAFVGRRRERRRMRRLLLLAAERRGQSCIIQGGAGEGRSRLLAEYALAARIVPAVVLQVDAASFPEFYGVANALALALLDTAPALAAETVAPYAPLLAHLSPRLRERLAVKPAEDSTGELRVHIQAALRDWFLAVAAEQCLVVLVDGLEIIDDGSAAFLLTLALKRKQARLLLVCTTLSQRRREIRPAERALIKQSRRSVLGPLSEEETFDLLHSLFGHAENLGRLASRLHRVSSGSPGHILELAQQLVRRDVIGFVAGNWVLPQELPETLLSINREEALAARLEYLDQPARELGQVLSLRVGVVSLELCKALASSISESYFLSLQKLLDEDVLVQSGDGVRFANEQLRLLLLAELPAERRKLTQRALAEFLLTQPAATTLDQLRAGLHLLDSGDMRGAGHVAKSALRLVVAEPDKITPALPPIEEALLLMRAAGRPPAELVALLAVLCIGGYYADRQYASRYGDTTVRTLRELLGLDLAIKLRRFLGRKLGLIAALIVALVRFRKYRENPCVPSFREVMLLFFNCVATLTATSIICMDSKAARRYASAIEPLTALGKRRISSFMYEFSSTIAETVRETHGETYPKWRRLVERLESDEEIGGMPPALRKRYLGGALYACGVIESQADDQRALATAERLDAVGMQLYELSAHQVRVIYYANQGQLKRSEHYREQVEQLAVQLGSSWQVETWLPPASVTLFVRTRDAMGMKLASEQLVRLSQDLQTADPYARRARGSYLALRKKYAEALPWLEECLQHEVRAYIGWGLAHGTLAYAYNRLGEYEKARAACMRVMNEFVPVEFTYTALNLLTQTELLIAEAGLGRADEAKQGLAALLAQHGPVQSPLTLGSLHETAIEIALITRDEQSQKLHLAEMRRYYLATGAPSLAQHCLAWTNRIEGTQRVVRGMTAYGGHSVESELQSAQSTYTALMVDRMLAGGGMSLAERAHKALLIIAENTRCSESHLYLLDDDAKPELIASLKGEAPAARVARWLESRVARELEEEMTQMLEDDDDDDDSNLNALAFEGRDYRVVLLAAQGAAAQGILGAVLLGWSDHKPSPCPAEILGSVARHLQRARVKARKSESAPQ